MLRAPSYRLITAHVHIITHGRAVGRTDNSLPLDPI